MRPLKLTSLNCNGLRDTVRARMILKEVESDIICLQETHWTPDKEQEVGKLWEGYCVSSCGAPRTGGVAILFKRERVHNFSLLYNGNDGRILVVEFTVGDAFFRLINIYAPVCYVARKSFFVEIGKWITEDTIIIGDFNVKLTRMDVTEDRKLRWDSSRQVLKDIIIKNNLVDVWRNANPFIRAYSRRLIVQQELRQSRIDLCLVGSKLVDKISNCHYRFNHFGDHAALICELGERLRARGGGTWVLNECVLKEGKYKMMLTKYLKETIESMDELNVCEWWINVKQRLKIKCIRLAKQINFKKNLKIRMVKDRIEREIIEIGIYKERDKTQYLLLKDELSHLEKEKWKGEQIRSKAKYITEGERPTAYFLSLEKAKQNRMNINELENAMGKKVNDFGDIIEVIDAFYRNLFKRGQTDKGCLETTLNSVKGKINNEDKMACDKDITVDEIIHAIDGMKCNKSPGIDGLTHEFFKEFKYLLAPVLCKIFQTMQKEGKMCEGMADGLIILLYKNKGSKLQLKNYRPLTLLNTDYKILTKVLANRLKYVIGTVVSRTQAYAIPGRNIACTAASVRDIIHYLSVTSGGGIVLNLDMNKAFDRVDHCFMFALLEKLGFGTQFIDWIKLIYKYAKSCVKVNGFLTDKFPLERSVRQGCPLSALLYSLIAEPFACLLKSREQIEPLQIPGGAISLIHQFADDTTITVRRMGSINEVMKVFEVYGRASGAKINVEKSCIMQFGDQKHVTCKWAYERKDQSIKILGLVFGEKMAEARNESWTGVINKMKQKVTVWRMRKLSLKGKVVVLNTLVISKLIYPMSVWEMPEWVRKEVKEVIENFLWNGKKREIAYNTLIADYKEGGLKLVDVESKLKALRIKYIQNYLYSKGNYVCDHFFRFILMRLTGCGDDGLFMDLNGQRRLMEGVPDFYLECFNAWSNMFKSIRYECKNLRQIYNQPLFLNRNIICKGKFCFNSSFMKAGITQVKDLAKEYVPGFINDGFVIEQVKDSDDTLGAKDVENFLRVLKDSLPKDWQYKIINQSEASRLYKMPELKVQHGTYVKEFRNLKFKEIYKILVKGQKKEPAAEAFWKKEFKDRDTKQIWKTLNIELNDVRCESLDFKLRSNILYSNMKISAFDSSVSGRCNVCKRESESIMHVFFECEQVREVLDRMWMTVNRKWSVKVVYKDWKWVYFKGWDVQLKGVNVALLNLFLSFLRRAVWLRRNMVNHGEGKVPVFPIFFKTLKAHLKVMFVSLERSVFEFNFVKGSSFVKLQNASFVLTF